jgi:hypothetical protein
MATNTQTFTIGGTGPNGATITSVFSFTGNFFEAWAQLAPAGTNTAIPTPTITPSYLDSFILVTDQNCTIANVTASSLSTATSALYLTMTSGIPVIWWSGMNYANPIPVALTSVYVSTAVAVNIQGGFLQNT